MCCRRDDYLTRTRHHRVAIGEIVGDDARRSGRQIRYRPVASTMS